MSRPEDFRPVTREEPCAICGHDRWCRRSATGGHECHRSTGESVNGYERVATTPAGFRVYRRPQERKIPSGQPPPPNPKPLRAFASPEDAAKDFAARNKGTVETIYRWTDTWRRARIRLPDGKAFCEITQNPMGWVQRGPTKPHPLYRVSEIPPAGTIFVCEGEKACDAGWSIGLPCVTSGAANSAQSADWISVRGHTVIILPDNDEPGAKYAREVAKQIKAIDPAITVKIVQLPGLAESEDLHDFVNEHRDSHESEEIRDEIMALASSTPAIEAPSESETQQSRWPDPQPLPEELPPVLPFDFELLPESLRPWIEDIAERVQCPPDFPAVAAMVAIATVVGRKIAIRPKRRDDWTVVPNLWGAVIGRPGIMKSPALQEALRLLRRLAIEAEKRFAEESAGHVVDRLVDEQQKKEVERHMREALRKEDKEEARTLARQIAAAQEKEPILKRYIVNDCTIEKLGEILNENPNGVVVFRDELIGFLRSLDKDGHESARGFYLEAWNGTGYYVYDRIGRGTLKIEAAIVSMIGGIQPGRLMEYVRGAADNRSDNDGLIQRFQLAVWPDVSRDWRNVDEWPDSEARNRAYEVFQRLDKLDPMLAEASRDNSDPEGIPHLRFDSEAQLEFDDWRAELERKVRSGNEHPAIEDHLAKYRSLIPSLALLDHLIDVGSGPVSVRSLRRAIAWGRYLESHARRIYAAAAAPDAAAARALALKILSGELGTCFALRDVYRPRWSNLTSREDAKRAVEVLIDLDWLAAFNEDTPGRPKTKYLVNEKLMNLPPDALTKLTKAP